MQRLKEEGNKFFGAGKYLEAAAKYEEVKSELAGVGPTFSSSVPTDHCP